MSRTPPHSTSHSGDTAPGGADAERNDQRRRRSRWAIQLWVVLAVLFFVGLLAGELMSISSAREVEVPLEFATPVPLAGLSAGAVNAGVIVPLNELATSTIVMVVLAHVLPIIGLMLCGIIGLLSLRQFSPEEALTAPSMRAVNRLSWAAFATAVSYYVPLHLGANMTTRDLQITAEANSGVSLVAVLVIFALVFALLGVLEIGRQVHLSGKRAQDELEGLI